MDNSHLSDQISHHPSSHPESSSALYCVPSDRPLGPFPPPTHSDYSHLHHRRPSMQFDNPQFSADSCIPSLLPPGVDPASVDFRTFYPYIPNEVKHRKRTSRAQLKVLEDIFKRDTKPNAQLRKKLAKQLDMTARGVQVWFQNRRAKEKTQAKKALTASKTLPIPDLSKSTQSSDPLPLTSDSPHPSLDGDLHPPSPESEDSVDEDTLEAMEPSSSSQFRQNSDSGLWQMPSNETTGKSGADKTAQPRRSESRFSALHGLRRGSLPLISVTSDNSIRGPQLDHLDPLARRRSVDTSLHRLASHPYAQMAIAKNGALYGPSSRNPFQLRLSSHPGMHNNPSVTPRPNLAHRASLPHEVLGMNSRQRSSFDSRGYHIPNSGSSSSQSPSPLSIRASNGLCSIPARSIPSPIPGPLPRADFSFGAPSLTPPASSPSPHCDSPESLAMLPAYTPARLDDPDTEDDGTSASYDAFSRFGSIASLAGSESSGTSAYYSDVGSIGHGSIGHGQDIRRGSCSGQILDLMSGLDVNGHSEHVTSPVGHNPFTPLGDRQGSNSLYPSPSSTVSPCHEQSPSALPISRSSELAYALQNKQEQAIKSGNDPKSHYRDPSETPVVDPQGASQSGLAYAYGQTPGTYHTHSASASSSSSSISLPMMEFAEKFEYEDDLSVYSSTGHYAAVPSFPPPNDGQFTADVSFTEGQDHRSNDFTQGGSSSDIYSTYAPNVPSVTHPLESFAQYS